MATINLERAATNSKLVRLAPQPIPATGFFDMLFPVRPSFWEAAMNTRPVRTTLLSCLIACLVMATAQGADQVPADPIEKIADQGAGAWKDIEAKMTGDADVVFAECSRRS